MSGEIVPIAKRGPPARPTLSAAQMRLIRATSAKDCDTDEFDQFMATAERLGLDPLAKQITAIVFGKKSSDRRQMAIIVTIDGYRAIAARSGDYRPQEAPPAYEYDPDLKCDTNPLGLVKAVVTVFRRYGEGEHAEWRPIVAEVYWDEIVPFQDEWAKDAQGRWAKTGRKTLPDSWRRMGRLMLAKCAEAQALRRGWPEWLSGTHTPEEMERAIIIDALASEVVEGEEKRRRVERVGHGGGPRLTLDFGADCPLESLGIGEVYDRVAAHLKTLTTREALSHFRDRNADSLRAYWAHAQGDALELKRLMEARFEALPSASGAEAADD